MDIKKIVSTKTLQLILLVYCILYFSGFIAPFFQGDMVLTNALDLSVLLMFVLFFIGFLTSWFNEQLGGLLLLAWYVFLWTLGYFFWPDAGMVIIFGVPVFVLGILLILNAYKTFKDPHPDTKMQWKYVLRVLLINYAILYLITVVADLSNGAVSYFFNFPFILFPLLLIVFILGFVLSWKRELAAGILFFIWYGIILFGTFAYHDFSNEGPYVLFGISILLQGIFYLFYHFRFNPRRV